MNKIKFITTLTTACVIGSYIYFSNNQEKEPHPTKSITTTPQSIKESKPTSKKIAAQQRQKIIEHPIQEPDESFEPSNIDQLMFSASQKAEDFLKASGKLRPDLEGEVYLEINSAQLLNLSKGDTFQLDIPELKILHDVEVKESYNDQFGNKTIEAHLPNEGMMYGSVFTINKHAIYANVSTPDGIYVMQGNGQYAWIAETNDLSKEAVMDPM